MALRLKWAMLLTFFTLGVLLWAVFWAAMWIAGISGPEVIAFTFGFVGFMIFIQWFIGPRLLLTLTKAKECTDPSIVEMVHRLADKSGIPKPKVYIVPNDTPNAFAFGRTRGSSCVALHTGLLEKLDRDEIEAVVAHEVGHIKHRDVLIMTLASALPVILFYLIYFGTIFASSRDERGGFNYLGAWIGGMVAQFIGFLLVMYLSRVREYYADAHSAYTTKKPVALADALAKITYTLAKTPRIGAARSMTTNLRMFYIADPKHSAADAEYLRYTEHMERERKRLRMLTVFMTHPPTYKRIEKLQKIQRKMLA